MKTKYLIIPLFIILLLVSCDLFNTEKTGSLLFKGVRVIPETALSKTRSVPSGHPDSATVHHMYNMDIKFNAHEIYVSKDQIQEDVTDNFTWVKIGENDELKYMSEYEFLADDIPEGTYMTLKIIFRNEIIRYAVYAADTNTVVEMAGSLGEGAAGDTSLIINCFSLQGSFNVDSSGVLHLMSPGETFSPFSIVANRTTTIYWKGGAADVVYKLNDFTFDWYDNDGDSAWTPGVDAAVNYDGPADTPMWSFLVAPGGPTSIGK